MWDFFDGLWSYQMPYLEYKVFLVLLGDFHSNNCMFYVLKTGTKHTSLKNRKLALLFSWRTAWEWLQLCCYPEKSHTRTAPDQVFTVLQIRMWLGPCAQLLCFCACMCLYMWIAHHGASPQMLPICPKCSVAACDAPRVQAGWGFVACGRGLGL